MPSTRMHTSDFLLSEVESLEPKDCIYCGNHFSGKRNVYLRSRLVILLLSGVILVLSAIGILYASTVEKSPKTGFSQGPSLYSPFSNGIQYEIQTTPPDYWNNDLYVGEPGDESELAWNKLIHPSREHGVRLLRDEGASLNINKSILLPDHNFAVILSVHHNLHCLRRLRQAFYEDHYYPNWTEEDRKHEREHNLHCLESMRTSMICQPDLAPLPYYWSGNAWHDMNASPQSKRECINWTFFSEYLKTRSYERSELIRDSL